VYIRKRLYISSVRLRDMRIKEFYLNEYPTDELGEELNENITFTDLLNALLNGINVYDFIGVGDSLIRERLFTRAAEFCNQDYEFVYQLWLRNSKSEL